MLGAGNRLDTNNATASVNLGSIAVTTSNGTGVLINGSPVTIIGATSTVSAQGGPALDISASNLGGYRVRFIQTNSLRSSALPRARSETSLGKCPAME